MANPPAGIGPQPEGQSGARLDRFDQRTLASGGRRRRALVVVATKLTAFQGETDAQVWAWCYRIASNKLKQCHQQAQRHPTESLDVEEIRRVVEAVAAEQPLPDGVRLDLEDALKLLEFGVPPCRDLLWFHYVLGLGYQKIADLYLMAYDTARMKIHRCLERAQELLGKGEYQSHV